MQLKKRIDYHVVLLPLSVITAFFFHYLSLDQTAYANGWDSYFYLLQVKSLMEDGYLISSRISIIYPVLAFFKWLSGDYVLGWKIFVSVCSSAAVFLSYTVVKELTSDKKAALFSTSISLCSPHLFYFSSQYAKNLLGFDFFLIFLLLLFRRNYMPAAAFVIINLLTHKLTGALSLITLGLFILYNILRKQNKKRILFISLLGIGPVLLLLFIPKIAGIDDLTRQIDFITLQPQCNMISFFRDFDGLQNLMWKIEIILVYISVCAVIFFLIRVHEKSFDYWIIPVLFIFLNIPFFKWDLNGFSFRFFMFSILFGSISGGIIISRFRNKKIVSLLIFTCIGITAFSYKTYDPRLHDPENKQYDRIVHKLKDSGVLNKSELLIAHKGLAEYIKFTTGKDAMSWIPEYEINEDSLWRISAGIRTHRFNTVIDPENIIKLCCDYNVMKEKDWQKFIYYIEETNSDFYDDYTTWMNPNKKRPLFLQKYRRKNDDAPGK